MEFYKLLWFLREAGNIGLDTYERLSRTRDNPDAGSPFGSQINENLGRGSWKERKKKRLPRSIVKSLSLFDARGIAHVAAGEISLYVGLRMALPPGVHIQASAYYVKHVHT